MTALIFILLCLIWGSTWLIIKIGLDHAPPLITASLRFMLAMVILSAVGLIRGYRLPKKFREIVSLGYPGLYMYGISYALVYFAEQYINSGLAAVLFGAFPFFVAIVSWLKFRSEKLALLGWLGMLLGMGGVVVISWNSFSVSEDVFLGTLLAAAAPLAAAYGIVLHKQHHVNKNIVVSTAVQMFFGGLLLVIGAVVLEDWSDFNITPESLGSIIYLAVMGTVVAFLSYYWLLKRLRAVSVALIAFITPLVALGFGVLLGGEALTVSTAFGTLLIFSGVGLVLRKDLTK